MILLFLLLPLAIRETAAGPHDYDIAFIIDNRDQAMSGEARGQVEALARMFERNFLAEHVIRLRQPTWQMICDLFGGCAAKGTSPWKPLIWQITRRDRSRLYVYYLGPGRLQGTRRQLLFSRAPKNSGRWRADRAYDLGWLHHQLGLADPRSTLVMLETSFASTPLPCANEGPLLHDARGAAQRQHYAELMAARTLPVKMAELSATIPITIANCDRFDQVISDRYMPLFTKLLLQGIAEGEADEDRYGNGNRVITLGEIEAFISDRIDHATRFQWGREQVVWRVGVSSRAIAEVETEIDQPPPRPPAGCDGDMEGDICRQFCAGENLLDPSCDGFCETGGNADLPACPDVAQVPAGPTKLDQMRGHFNQRMASACEALGGDEDGSLGTRVERCRTIEGVPTPLRYLVPPLGVGATLSACAYACNDLDAAARRQAEIELNIEEAPRPPLIDAEERPALVDRLCGALPPWADRGRWLTAGWLIGKGFDRLYGCDENLYTRFAMPPPIDLPPLREPQLTQLGMPPPPPGWSPPPPSSSPSDPPPDPAPIVAPDPAGIDLSPSEARWLQAALLFGNHDPGAIDGAIGPQTKDALRRWRRAHQREGKGGPTAEEFQTIVEDFGALFNQGELKFR